MKKWLLYVLLISSSLFPTSSSMVPVNDSISTWEDFNAILAYTFIATFGISMCIMHKRPLRDSFMRFVHSCKTESEYEFRFAKVQSWNPEYYNTDIPHRQPT